MRLFPNIKYGLGFNWCRRVKKLVSFNTLINTSRTRCLFSFPNLTISKEKQIVCCRLCEYMELWNRHSSNFWTKMHLKYAFLCLQTWTSLYFCISESTYAGNYLESTAEIVASSFTCANCDVEMVLPTGQLDWNYCWNESANGHRVEEKIVYFQNLYHFKLPLVIYFFKQMEILFLIKFYPY